jgi:carbon storage regulator CsrA
MLVLGRDYGESVVIEVPPNSAPTRITVIVCDVRGESRVRLGFEAPPQVRIDRSEVFEAKRLNPVLK